MFARPAVPVLPTPLRLMPMVRWLRTKASVCWALGVGGWAGSVALAATGAIALPQNGQVQAGQAAINSVNPTQLDILQSSERAVIDWTSFSIAPAEQVNFRQPSSSASTLNRVTGTFTSTIAGQINANGQVLLVNPNGILFTPTAQINVGSFLGTTLDIANQDFWDDRLAFQQRPDQPLATILNQGTITVAEGGFAAFVAPGVANQGIINARLGHIVLASGTQATLDFYGDGLVAVAIAPEFTDQLITGNGQPVQAALHNSGSLIADGGTVTLTAQTGAQIVNSAINLEGIIQAQSIANHQGNIVLAGGDQGAVNIAGLIDASGRQTEQQGGTVEISGQHINLLNGTEIDLSGNRQGGTAIIGGNINGMGPLPQAQTITASTTVQINANALTQGHGGQVNLWSRQRTDFAGAITARGAGQNGDGGLIDTSSQGTLNIASTAHIDAGAHQGQPGTWRLDPDRLIIDADSPGPLAGPPTGEQSVAASVIANSLVNQNVDLVATTDIEVNAEINTSSQLNSNTLNFQDQDGDGNLTVTLNAGIILNDLQTLTGNANIVNVNIDGPNTLQAGIDVAANGAQVNVSEGIFTSTNNAVANIEKDLTIIGQGPDNTILDGEDTRPGVTVDVFGEIGSNVFLENLTIRNGFDSLGGGISNGSTLTITDSKISGNSGDEGGGIFNLGTLNINNSTISENSASNLGGGIFNVGLTILTDSTVSNNVATTGGGIYSNIDTILDIKNSTISNNIASGAGGGILNIGSTTLTDSTISENEASIGGGIHNGFGVIEDVIDPGGDILPIMDIFPIEDLPFSEGTIPTEGLPLGEDSPLFEVPPSGKGPKMIVEPPIINLTVLDSTISGNSAVDGAGIYNQGMVTIRRSTISSNSADANGGGLLNQDFLIFGEGMPITSTALIENSTVSGNSGNLGGGIYNTSDLTLRHTTISNNTADTGGGIYSNSPRSAIVGIDNSIVSGNIANTGPEVNPSNDLNSNGFNLVGQDGDPGGFLTAANDIIHADSVDTIITPLGDFGGPTLTHTLLPGSPAIAAGSSSLEADQRGEPRDVGTPDIGANESAGFSLETLAGSPQSTTVDSDFTTPLQAIISETISSGPIAIPGVEITFTAPNIADMPGGTFADAIPQVTDVAGIATASVLAANTVAGDFSAIASANDSTLSTTFALANTPDVPANLAITSGDNQSTVVNTPFADDLVVTVTDQFDNLIPDALITFTPDAAVNGASIQGGSQSLNSDLSGIGNLSVIANSIAGAHQVTASTGALTSTFTLTNTPDIPANLIITSGDNQSTVVNTAFSDDLVVTVTDQFDNLIPDALITFTPDAAVNGASIQGGSQSTNSDLSGIANLSVIANTIAGNHQVTASTGALSTTFALTNTPDVPANLAITSGDNQSTVVNTAFSDDLVVTVTDQFDNLIPDALITFTPDAAVNGASIQGGSQSLNSDLSGIANLSVIANTIAGAHQVTASTGALTSTFTLTNTPDIPANLIITSGDNQSTVVNTAFSDDLVVTVTDQFDNLIPDALITFTPDAAVNGASIQEGSQSTNSDLSGIANLSVIANTIAGDHQVTASTGALTSTFTLTNTPDIPANLIITSGDNQSTVVNTAFSDDLVVTVTDQFDNLIPDALITFTPDAAVNGASIQGGSQSLNSDLSGIANLSVIANTIAGAHQVTASTGTLTSKFALTNTPDVPANLAITSGDNQSTVVNTPFADDLVVTVTDQFDNLIPDALITFTPDAAVNGASIQGGSQSTNSDLSGIANLSVIANTIAGAHQVTASAGTLTSTFTLSNTPDVPANLAITSGDNQSTVVNTAFSDDLVVTVTDQFDNLIPDALITFTPDAAVNGASIQGGSQSTNSDLSGIANLSVIANTIAGNHQVTASTGALSTTFTLTNTPDVPANLGITSGDNQSTVVNTAFSDDLVVTVTDQFDNLIPDALITFTPDAAVNGASIQGESQSINSDLSGIANLSVIANTIAGDHQVTASTGALTSTFTLNNTPDVPANLTITGGNNQSTVVSTLFPEALEVIVADQFGNPIPEVLVDFNAPNDVDNAGGIFAGLTTLNTDDLGMVTASPLVANAVAGDFTVTATTGTLAPENFTLTNLADVSSSNSIVFNNTEPDQTEIPMAKSDEPNLFPFSDLRVKVPIIAKLNTRIETLERYFTSEFASHLGLQNTSIDTSTLVRETLTNIKEVSGANPAVIYAYFATPANRSNEDLDAKLQNKYLIASTSSDNLTQQSSSLNCISNQELHGADPLWQFDSCRWEKFFPQLRFRSRSEEELVIVLVTADGEVARRQVKGANRSVLTRIAQRFQRNVQRQNSPNRYLPQAQQLYEWLVQPIASELEAADINNLVFILDQGLRSIPLAALHDGNQYLIEQYSVGLMPSLSLSDTQYVDLRGKPVLAMGAEMFSDHSNLPAVPLEIATISQLQRGGSVLLNDEFTINKLKQIRREKEFNIVHLATHGNFRPGKASRSYIQFWDARLALDQFSDLNLANAPEVRLLVLSACRTALGDPEAELGFAGFAVSAGVPTAVGSLWSISDLGTLGFMANFYSQLQETPIKAEALRRTQLAILKGEVRVENSELVMGGNRLPLPNALVNQRNLDFRHPYFWSGLTMIGNPW